MEKLALALVTASRKLRPYFQSHTIRVLTNYPLRQILQKLDASCRLLKWAIELSQFDIEFLPRPAIKGQALADFIAEFTNPEGERLEEVPITTTAKLPRWELFVDRSSNEGGSGAGLILVSPEGHRVHYALRFGFKASNNETEYKALIAGLKLAKEMKVECLEIYSDSQLVVYQVTNEYQARSEKMAAYLQTAKDLLHTFSSFKQADALARLASTKDAELLKVVPIEFLSTPSIKLAEPQLTVNCVTSIDTWMTPIIQYLKDGHFPEDKKQARTLRFKAARYVLYDRWLYKRGFLTPLVKCVDPAEGNYILWESHEGVCGNHYGGQSLAYKVLRQGYY